MLAPCATAAAMDTSMVHSPTAPDGELVTSDVSFVYVVVPTVSPMSARLGWVLYPAGRLAMNLVMSVCS